MSLELELELLHDAMDLQDVLEYPSNSTNLVQNSIRYILTGSFRSLSLFLLAFSTETRKLTHVETIPAFGPHQYLATNPQKDRVYATSWALPPALSSWEILRSPGEMTLKHVNSVPITATSSYITIPAPYTHVYSAGGPTGEVHALDPVTGGFSEKIQQILFVPEDELETADKTRVALRYGSHAVEFSPSRQLAFIPVLGTDSIEMYEHNKSTGHLRHLTSVGSPRGRGANDGPRHVKVHPNGNVLYSVTEHTNFVDAYIILPTTLKYVSSRSILPDQFDTHRFRGDTLMLSPPSSAFPNPRVLFTTTRGGKTDSRGWLTAFSLNEEGLFTSDIQRFETPTSGGRANAIDVLHKKSSGEDGLWILLTDEDDATAAPSGTGAVRVLEWDQIGIRLVCEWPSSGDEAGASIMGASHAIWLD